MSNATYSVPNISCGHCVNRIQTALAKMAGVKTVKADAGTKRVEVNFDAPASDAAIKAKLAEINYPAVS